jgi:hypothetical protein
LPLASSCYRQLLCGERNRFSWGVQRLELSSIVKFLPMRRQCVAANAGSRIGCCLCRSSSRTTVAESFMSR